MYNINEMNPLKRSNETHLISLAQKLIKCHKTADLFTIEFYVFFAIHIWVRNYVTLFVCIDFKSSPRPAINKVSWFKIDSKYSDIALFSIGINAYTVQCVRNENLYLINFYAGFLLQDPLYHINSLNVPLLFYYYAYLFFDLSHFVQWIFYDFSAMVFGPTTNKKIRYLP